MYWLDKLADKFWDIERWAKDLKDDLYGWPWPLSYLGYPFAWFAYHLWYLAHYTDHISNWADGIEDSLHDILSWYDIYWKIRSYFPIVEKTWADVLNAMPRWSDLKPTWFPSTLSAFIAMMPTWEDIVPYWIPTSLSDFKNKIVLYVAERFESILDRVFKES